MKHRLSSKIERRYPIFVHDSQLGVGESIVKFFEVRRQLSLLYLFEAPVELVGDLLDLLRVGLLLVVSLEEVRNILGVERVHPLADDECLMQ
jgi:hypothetical protein